ncbi:MAG: hypothetical protein RJA79_75, partial [Actinomycetota bacterium]
MSDPKSRRGTPRLTNRSSSRTPNRPLNSRPTGESTENASGNIGSSSNVRQAVATPTGFAALGVSERVDAG